MNVPQDSPDSTIYTGLHLYDGVNNDAVVERVAYGGFGVIAFAPNRIRNQEMTAYKTLRRELLDDPAAHAGFVRECLLWVGLWDHPNIATAYGVLELGDERGLRPFIALRYADGGSLRDVLRAAARQPGGRLPLELGLYLAQEIAAGLAYLHLPDPAYLRPEPTVHRDLKPENVLLMESGQAMITDFGLAKVIEGASEETLVTLMARLAGGLLDTEAATRTAGLRTAAGLAMGTAAYMPPEQWVDARSAGPPADIYAFGVILSELLAGRHALLDLNACHTPDEWRQAHERPAPRLLRSVDDRIPMEVETLYLRCLAANPAARPSAAETLATLQAGARAAGLEAYEPPQLVSHTPHNEFVHSHEWSIACFNLKRYDEALEHSAQALALARQLVSDEPQLLPSALITHANILKGQGYEALKRGDRATAARLDAQVEVAYQEALETCEPPTTASGKGSHSVIWHQLGTFHNERRRWPQAEEAYAKALAYMADKATTFYARAKNLLEWGMEDDSAGRNADAVVHLRQARVHALTAVGLQYPPARKLLGYIEEGLAELGVS